MAEMYQLSIDEAFRNGIRHKAETRMNTPFLEQCRGLRPLADGLELPEYVRLLGDTVQAYAPPYPQIHNGDVKLYSLYNQSIKEFDPDTLAVVTSMNEECCSNGNFTTETVPGTPDDWTLGAGWALAAGKITHTPGSTNTVTQTAAAQRASVRYSATATSCYKVTLTVSGMTAGTLNVGLGTTGLIIDADGTYTAYMKPTGTTIKLTPSSDFDGSVDDISVISCDVPVLDIADCSNPTVESAADTDFNNAPAAVWTTGVGHAYPGADDKLTLTAAADGTETYQTSGNQVSALVPGKVYRVTYTVSGYSAGGVRVCLGNYDLTTFTGENAGTLRAADGTYEEDLMCLRAAGGDISIHIVAVGATTLKVDDLSVKLLDYMEIPADGGTWRVTDFGNVHFMSKDEVFIARVPYYSQTKAGEPRLVGLNLSDHDVQIRAIGNIGSRLLLGGITADTLVATSEWQYVWDTWLGTAPENILTDSNLVFDAATVMYSAFAGGAYDFPFAPELSILQFYPRAYASEDFIDTYRDMLMKREIGFLPLPWRGELLQLKALGNGAVAYCTTGISYIQHNEMGQLMQVPVLDVGLADVNCLTGDERQHVFIDTTGHMRRLKADMSMDDLDYHHLFSGYTFSYFSATWDAKLQEAYFTYTDTPGTLATTLTYILTPFGLCTTTNNKVISVARIGEYLTGSYFGGSDSTFTLETVGFDMGMDVQKVLVSFGLAVMDASAVSGTVYYRNDRLSGDSGYRAITSLSANRSNQFLRNVVGRDFKILVSGTVGTDTKAERMLVTYKVAERGNLAYVTTANL